MKYLLIIALLTMYGCSVLAPHVRTVYVPEGDAVMLREDVKNVDVWAWPEPDADPLPGNITLEEGWT